MAKSPDKNAPSPMTPDDDILPRRVVGEEPIAREAVQDAANPYQRGERHEDHERLRDSVQRSLRRTSPAFATTPPP